MATINKRYKTYFKLNLISIIFIAFSLIFTTFAWFAYSGLSSVETELDVKAWYIELTKKGEKVSNEVVVTLSDIYPGMEPVNELINIENKGDSEATLKYEIMSARVLGDAEDKFDVEENNDTSDDIEDKLSHNYPFHINMSLSKRYLSSAGGKGNFDVSVSWPLEAGHDEEDSLWGQKAYQFQEIEKSNKEINSSYKMKPSIEIVIRVTAEQFIGTDTSNAYNFGDTVLYDVQNNVKCYELGGTCIKTTYIDNKLANNDDVVQLLPNIYDTYPEGSYDNYDTLYNGLVSNYGAPVKPMTTEDALKIISYDIHNSYLVNDNISDVVIGNLNKAGNATNAILKANNMNAYFVFNKELFPFLYHSKCIWTKSSDANAPYALDNKDNVRGQLSRTSSATECSVIPIITVPKENLLSEVTN